MTQSKRINTGQTILVTGASSGIGLELARCFAEDGADLVLTARSATKLAELSDDVSTKHGIRVDVIVCDLAATDGATKLLAELADRRLCVDVLVNNAGYGLSGALAQADLHNQLDMLRLNTQALTELSGSLLPGMIARGEGGILNIASMAAFSPVPFMAVYAATKAYVLSFTEALWEEARGTGVRISCLCPGSTESGFHERAGTDKLKSTSAVMMPAATVARIGYKGFIDNKRVVVPGFGNKVARGALGALPDSLTLKLVRRAFST